MTKRLCLITFLRGGERFTSPFKELVNTLAADFDTQVKCIIFVENIVPVPDGVKVSIEQIVKSGTKYQRLLSVLKKDTSEYFLCVDNDVINNLSEVSQFVQHMLSENYDAGWGKILAENPQNLVAKMVAVDKVLSHRFIRPLLWQIRLAITVPGQCFMVRRKAFSGKLSLVDTYLDDLALGLYIRQNFKHLKVYFSDEVLGFEKPNNTWRGLLSQRKRWAKGYASLWCSARSTIYFPYVIIHGLAYHTSWVLHWLLIIGLGLINPIMPVIYLTAVTLALSAGDSRQIIASALYQIAFPILHGRWLWFLIKDLIKNR